MALFALASSIPLFLSNLAKRTLSSLTVLTMGTPPGALYLKVTAAIDYMEFGARGVTRGALNVLPQALEEGVAPGVGAR